MDEIRLLVKDELLSVENRIKNLVNADNEILAEIKHFITSSSKRIRSVLALLYLKANNKEITNDIINILAVGELIHNASLLHDDVLDSSKYRRGEITIGTKFSPQMAILSGDLLLSLAVKLLMEINNSEILKVFLDCTNKMSLAEINQFLLRGKMPQEDEYINICEGKTASLFAAILKSAALLSELDTNYAQILGEKFGILFQLKNDLEPNSAQNDIKNNIKTAMTIFGVEKTFILTDNYKREFKSIVRGFENRMYSDALGDLADKL